MIQVLQILRVEVQVHHVDAEGGPEVAVFAASAAGQARLWRVKVWRRLQALGAVAVKNSVYALPANASARGLRMAAGRSPKRRRGDDLRGALVDGLTDEEVSAVHAARVSGLRRASPRGARPAARSTTTVDAGADIAGGGATSQPARSSPRDRLLRRRRARRGRRAGRRPRTPTAGGR